MQPTSSKDVWRVCGLAAGLLLIGFVLVDRVGTIPHIWYDEGAHLHVAKNLAVNDVYADFSSDGNRYTGPVVGVGPTLILPIAGLFKVFGVGVLLGRLVVALYALGAVVALFALGRALADRKLAIIAVALMVSVPGFTYYGRSVLGEVPALFFLLAALSVWLGPSGRVGRGRLVAAGLLFGLCCITKSQYALFVLPSLLLAWLADLVAYRSRGSLYFVIPGTIAGILYGVWMGFVLFILGHGARDVGQDLAILEATSNYALLFRWSLDNVRELWWSFPEYAILCLIAFPFWLLFGRGRAQTRQRWDTIVLFTGMAALLYLFSFGWTRYAFPAMMLSVPVAAYFVYELAGGLEVLWGAVPRLTPRVKSGLRIGGAVVVSATLGIAVAQASYSTLNRASHEDALAMADYLEQHVPKDAVIETLEQEFAILTDRIYHYPPQKLIVAVTAEWSRRGRTVGANYDSIPYEIRSDRVLSRKPPNLSADFYSPARLQGFQRVFAVGQYVLFRRGNAPAGISSDRPSSEGAAR